MPTYIDTATVLELLPGLPQATASAGWTATMNVINRAMESAEGTVNGFCARRYDIPFGTTVVPPIIRTITRDLTCYHVSKQLYSRDAQNVSDWTAEFKSAMEQLTDIRDKKMDLANTAGSILSEKSASSKVYSSTDYSPIFEVDTDTSWAVDEDRLDDVETMRE